MVHSVLSQVLKDQSQGWLCSTRQISGDVLFCTVHCTWHTLIPIGKYSMFLFPTIFTLGDIRIYIHSSNSHNMAFYIEASVDQIFCLITTLGIPNVQPYNHHIRLGQSVVATTHRNSACSLLTSAKLSTGYLVVGITRELDKEPSLHCYPIYISYKWSMLQQCLYLMSTPQ